MPARARGGAVKAAMNALGMSNGDSGHKPHTPDRLQKRGSFFVKSLSSQTKELATKPINLKRTIHDLERWPQMVKG